MPKIKFTKGELKRQRDALRQYERYLPTLQLKKQQLQIEIVRQNGLLAQKEAQREREVHQAMPWAALLAEGRLEPGWIVPEAVRTSVRNIAGVVIPVFESASFAEASYDLFLEPAWLDHALDAVRELRSLVEEIAVIRRGIGLLKKELLVTTQRVNLFEKVKIPEAKETIRRIKITLGDQMANAVGRSKIAKRKIEAFVAAQMPV
jgi:V/A-type H+-transporting ATPase subunit D